MPRRSPRKKATTTRFPNGAIETSFRLGEILWIMVEKCSETSPSDVQPTGEAPATRKGSRRTAKPTAGASSTKGKGIATEGPALPLPPPRSRSKKANNIAGPSSAMVLPQPPHPTGTTEPPKSTSAATVAQDCSPDNADRLVPGQHIGEPSIPAPAYRLPALTIPKPGSITHHVTFADQSSSQASPIPASPVPSVHSWVYSPTAPTPPLSSPVSEPEYEVFNLSVSGTESEQSQPNSPLRELHPQPNQHPTIRKSTGPAGSKRGNRANDIWPFFEEEGPHQYCVFCTYVFRQYLQFRGSHMGPENSTLRIRVIRLRGTVYGQQLGPFGSTSSRNTFRIGLRIATKETSTSRPN